MDKENWKLSFYELPVCFDAMTGKLSRKEWVAEQVKKSNQEFEEF